MLICCVAAEQGGVIVSPVNSELRVIRVSPDGTVTQKNLTPVRYSDLVVRLLPWPAHPPHSVSAQAAPHPLPGFNGCCRYHRTPQ